MSLHHFLDEHRDQILERTQRRIASGSPAGTDDELIESIPELFDDLVAELRRQVGLERETQPTTLEKSATTHGAQRLRLGFTITEVVHDYGALCNSITELAEQEGSITPKEYQTMNQVLDAAIAASVSEYSSLRDQEHDRRAEQQATEHLGFVAHELRNAISAALLSFDALRRGQVAIGGRTSNVLERSLLRLRGLIDRSLSEVRLKSGLALYRERTNFRQLLDEIEASVTVEMQAKGAHIVVEADPALEGAVDRQLLISALANLVQNGIKYSHDGATIRLRCKPGAGGRVTFEVEDECGGIAEDKLAELFTPFVRGTSETSGLGLGLAITRQAIEAHGGRVDVRNLPGRGCVFVVEIPVRGAQERAPE
jgi:signal transduction histidine kinase